MHRQRVWMIRWKEKKEEQKEERNEILNIVDVHFLQWCDLERMKNESSISSSFALLHFTQLSLSFSHPFKLPLLFSCFHCPRFFLLALFPSILLSSLLSTFTQVLVLSFFLPLSLNLSLSLLLPLPLSYPFSAPSRPVTAAETSHDCCTETNS